ncbi:hypothetical protein FOFC_02231 [Fusarium oxysporum]|nr:hypothetical protein FOFC_12104 [Fusarium oxysporum]KAI8419641.1 hypothetical protein FOFC_02231 [Fusarium oxysporum]
MSAASMLSCWGLIQFLGVSHGSVMLSAEEVQILATLPH